jgi:hypothetical protein
MSKRIERQLERVYAIIRLEPETEDDLLRFNVTRIVWSEDRARLEVERLNTLNGDKGCRYYWIITRLEPKNLLQDKG